MPDGSAFTIRHPLAMGTIVRVVAQRYGVTIRALRGPRRIASLMWPRHVAQYLCRHRTKASYPAIGQFFGGRDHSSIMYAVRLVGQRMADDAAVFDEVVGLHVRLDAIRPAQKSDAIARLEDPFIAELVAAGIRRKDFISTTASRASTRAAGDVDHNTRTTQSSTTVEVHADDASPGDASAAVVLPCISEHCEAAQ
jgi:hypothetical protein